VCLRFRTRATGRCLLAPLQGAPASCKQESKSGWCAQCPGAMRSWMSGSCCTANVLSGSCWSCCCWRLQQQHQRQAACAVRLHAHVGCMLRAYPTLLQALSATYDSSSILPEDLSVALPANSQSCHSYNPVTNSAQCLP
jgi:hypothetical protein